MKTEQIEARMRRAKASHANWRKWGGLSKRDAVQAWKDGFAAKRTNDPRKLAKFIAAHGSYMRGGNIGDAAWIERDVQRVIEIWLRQTR